MRASGVKGFRHLRLPLRCVGGSPRSRREHADLKDLCDFIRPQRSDGVSVARSKIYEAFTAEATQRFANGMTASAEAQCKILAHRLPGNSIRHQISFGNLEQCSILTPDWAQVRVGSCFRSICRLHGFLFPPTASFGILRTTLLHAAARRSSVTRRRML
jgi:hypothetical protein